VLVAACNASVALAVGRQDDVRIGQPTSRGRISNWREWSGGNGG
jgi:hypothetical protein